MSFSKDTTTHCKFKNQTGSQQPLDHLSGLNSCCRFHKLPHKLKVNLHSTRFSFVFVRFFTFLFLLDTVCAFSSAFLCVHIRTNQTVTYWTKVFRKNFFVKGYSSILKYRSYRSFTKFFNKIFIYI